MNEALLYTQLPGIALWNRGKVRDIYDLGEHLLIVATDRISAFDCVMPNGIPDKGRVLTGLSLFWFDLTADLVPNHLVSADVAEFPPSLAAAAEVLRGRSMLVKRSEVVPVECVVRGYLAGSGWREYQERGTVCGHPLPAGLRQADRLPEPLFTPATKAATGHDENISIARMRELVGAETAAALQDKSLALYRRAADYARERGILIADTKFEFGWCDGELLLVDEVLTPDSSRFWDAAQYAPGSSPPSFDKQFVRDYLESLGWNKEPPAPELPPDIVAQTRAKYLDAYRRLVGQDLPD
jgi:phosphoribosylaminoimidazole-succinocarboxamide synthase